MYTAEDASQLLLVCVVRLGPGNTGSGFSSGGVLVLGQPLHH